jgi:hypothetical protein
VGEAHDGLGRADRPGTEAAGQARGNVIDDGQQPGVVVLELPSGLVQCLCQAGDLGLADGLLAAGMSGQVTVGQGGQGRLGQRLAGGAAVGVVPAQQQASSRANPALSLPIRSTASGLPAASAISTS